MLIMLIGHCKELQSQGFEHNFNPLSVLYQRAKA